MVKSTRPSLPASRSAPSDRNEAGSAREGDDVSPFRDDPGEDEGVVSVWEAVMAILQNAPGPAAIYWHRAGGARRPPFKTSFRIASSIVDLSEARNREAFDPLGHDGAR